MFLIKFGGFEQQPLKPQNLVSAKTSPFKIALIGHYGDILTGFTMYRHKIISIAEMTLF